MARWHRAMDIDSGSSPWRKNPAILKDYGFLVGRMASAGDPDAVALLRRATEPGPREPLRVEAKAAYAKYLALGGKPVREMQAWVDDSPATRAGTDLCRTVVEFADAGRLGELIRSNATDLPVGARTLDLEFATEGTAHVPAMYAWDAADDRSVENLPVSGGEGLWGGDRLGLVVVGGAAHVLH